MDWVDAKNCIDCQVRLFDRLFISENPEKTQEGKTFLDNLNPDSLRIVENAKAEAELINSPKDRKYQFERLGYFVQDYNSKPEKLIFNRISTLKDSWKKE